MLAAAPAYAGWTAQVRADSGAVTAGTLSVSAAGLNTVAGSFTGTVRSATGSIVVTDMSATTSTQAADVTVAFSAPAGPAALTSVLSIAAWWTTAATCDASTVQPVNAATGTWGAGLTLTGGSLGRGASQRACVRTAYANMQDVASVTGSQSFQPVVTATSRVRGFASTAPEKATASTTVSNIFPLVIPDASWYQVVLAGTSLCIDVADNMKASGTKAVLWTCHATATTLATNYYNQSFRFNPYAQDLTMTPRHAQDTVLTMGAVDGATATITTRNLPSTNQQWQLQQVNTSTYALVSSDGRCLTAQSAAASALLVPAACAQLAAQKFQLRLSDTKA